MVTIHTLEKTSISVLRFDFFHDKNRLHLQLLATSLPPLPSTSPVTSIRLLDHTVASVLLTADQQLIEAAKR